MLRDSGIPAELCTTPRQVPKEFGTIKRKEAVEVEGGVCRWLVADASAELGITGLFQGCKPEGGLKKSPHPNLNSNHKC